MTVPHERFLAISRTRQFLLDLQDSKKWPRIPLSLRREARSLTKHYPADAEFEYRRELREWLGSITPVASDESA